MNSELGNGRNRLGRVAKLRNIVREPRDDAREVGEQFQRRMASLWILSAPRRVLGVGMKGFYSGCES